MLIGITSATCQRNHKNAIQFASEIGIQFLQIYLGSEDLQEGDDYFLGISKLADRLKIGLITHISEDLNCKDLDEISRKHFLVLENQEKKIAVLHSNASLKENIIKTFNEKGITVYIENYHRGISKKSELLKHDEFVEFVIRSSDIYDVGAVVDFPRYFGDEDADSAKKIKGLIVKDLEEFQRVGVSVLFHTIGKKVFRQVEETGLFLGTAMI